MPSSLHLSSQTSRRPKSDQQKALTTAMKPKPEPKKASNGSAPARREKAVRYRECRKNHAASIGGYAVDGCREFMAAGAEGTSDALRCAACSCHRSFHKREVEQEAVCDCECSSVSTSR